MLGADEFWAVDDPASLPLFTEREDSVYPLHFDLPLCASLDRTPDSTRNFA